MRRVTPALCLALVLGLCACAGPPRGLMTPVPVTGDAGARSAVNMLVVTTRQRAEGNDAILFNGERSTGLSFADVTVSIPPEARRTQGEVQWPERVPGNPDTDFVTTRADVLPLVDARRRFEQRLVDPRIQGRVLVFVHGYNTRFESAVMRFAQIVHDSRAPSLPVLFTWPSRGQLTAYTYDRESANYSRDGLETALAEIAKNPRVREIAIIAHSMGNWVTLEALRQGAIRNDRVHPKIREVMLAAPDVDADVFRTQIAALGPSRPNMTLFVARDDAALGLSRRLWGDVQRVGSIDVGAEPFRSYFLRERITVVDLTELRTGDPVAHEKFARSPEVVQFIGRRLVDGQRVGDQTETLAHRLSEAGRDVGGIVGAVITAPFTILTGGQSGQ